MTCADCNQPMRAEVLGIPKCTDHYIEALEHSAHITSLVKSSFDPLDVHPGLVKSLDKVLDTAIKNGKWQRFVPGELKNNA